MAFKITFFSNCCTNTSDSKKLRTCQNICAHRPRKIKGNTAKKYKISFTIKSFLFFCYQLELRKTSSKIFPTISFLAFGVVIYRLLFMNMILCKLQRRKYIVNLGFCRFCLWNNRRCSFGCARKISVFW